MGDEHHVRGRTGGDRRERPADARRQDIGHRTGPFGQMIEAMVPQPGYGAAPALRRPVAALGEDDEGALGVQAGRQALDLADVVARSAVRPGARSAVRPGARSGARSGPAVDERVGQPVGGDVEARIQLQRGLHHDARAPPAGAEQVMDEQQRVAGARVTAEHDERAFCTGAGTGAFGSRRAGDVDAQAAGALGGAVHQAEEAAYDPVVAALVGLGVQPPAEPAHDPQAAQDRQRRGLAEKPDQREAHHPQ